MNTQILLLGKNGQVGWELERLLGELGEVTAPGKEDLDLRRFAAIREFVRETKPDLIVNAAAYTSVDRAESEPETALAVNGEAPGVLAEECARLGAGLVHFSTDYVFDGTQATPYTEMDMPNPINTYGKSKWVGERAIEAAGAKAIILRTSWVYSLRRDCFVTRVIGWALEKQELKIVDDQVSNPTWCRRVAEATVDILRQGNSDLRGFMSDNRGVFHLASAGRASRYEWAKAILAEHPQPSALLAKELIPAKSEEFPAPARRPAFSALDCSRLMGHFGMILPSWEHDLSHAFDSLREVMTAKEHA